jgi:hypothetical protein
MRCDHASILIGVFSLCALSFSLPLVLALTEILVLTTFCFFEFCCGIYYPTMGSLRALVVPEEARATVMNCFRIPLNVAVVIILLVVDSLDDPQRFLLSSLLMIVGLCASLVASNYATSLPPPPPHQKSHKDTTPRNKNLIRTQEEKGLQGESPPMVVRQRSTRSIKID